jgi:hypothetical protein
VITSSLLLAYHCFFLGQLSSKETVIVLADSPISLAIYPDLEAHRGLKTERNSSLDYDRSCVPAVKLFDSP